jgi:SAM-dependent methyltransferase
MIAHDWYHQSFDALYPIVYAHRTVEAARPESRFSIEQTRLGPNDRVLDLCCGSGRHVSHLLEVTPHVVGMDYSPHLLEMAQDLLGPRARLVRADMGCQPFAHAFDVVMNYFTSFGYYPTREGNLGVVRGMVRILKPGGRFFLDYLNRTWIETHLEDDTLRIVQGFEIRERRWIDPSTHRINKTTIVSRGGQCLKDAGESVQLYTRDELVQLLTDGGLRVDRLFGNYDASPCHPGQPRMIAVGARA